MSNEVCPFCGKTYKRLKSHLPHCKARAENPQTPVSEHHVKPSEPTSSSPMVASFSEPTAMEEKSTKAVSTSPQSKKRRKMSAVSSASSQSPSPAATSNTASTSTVSQSSSLPPSAKKRNPKLSEQIMKASTPSPPSISPPLSPSPILSKKKSLRAQIEAAKLDQAAKGSPEGTRSAPEDLPSGSAPLLTDPLRARATVQTEPNVTPDNTCFAAVSTDSKRQDAPQKNGARTKSAAPSRSTNKDSEFNQMNARDKVQVDSIRECEDPSRNNTLSAHQSRITIQDVRAMLGRAKSSTQSSRARFLCQVDTTENQSSKSRRDPPLAPVTAPPETQEDAVSCLVTAKAPSELLHSVRAQHPEKQSLKKNSSKSLIPLQHDGSSQPKLTPPAAPFPLSQVSQATPLPHAGSVTDGLKLGHHMSDLTSLSSPFQFPSRHPLPAASQPLPVRAETYRADDALKLEDRKQDATHNGTEAAVTQRSLGQVRLRELPEWLACKTPRHPRDVVGMMQRGWQWYYRRYIDVKKGGVGGLAMLLAGYCVLSYVWSYPHIKRDRWRKHH